MYYIMYVHYSMLYVRSRVSWGRQQEECVLDAAANKCRCTDPAPGWSWLVLVLVLGVRGAALECGVKRAPQLYYR